MSLPKWFFGHWAEKASRTSLDFQPVPANVMTLGKGSVALLLRALAPGLPGPGARAGAGAGPGDGAGPGHPHMYGGAEPQVRVLLAVLSVALPPLLMRDGGPDGTGAGARALAWLDRGGAWYRSGSDGGVQLSSRISSHMVVKSGTGTLRNRVVLA